MFVCSLHGNREISRLTVGGSTSQRPASGRRGAEADDARTGEVRLRLDAACCDASLGEHINLTGDYLWRSSAKVGAPACVAWGCAGKIKPKPAFLHPAPPASTNAHTPHRLLGRFPASRSCSANHCPASNSLGSFVSLQRALLAWRRNLGSR